MRSPRSLAPSALRAGVLLSAAAAALSLPAVASAHRRNPQRDGRTRIAVTGRSTFPAAPVTALAHGAVRRRRAVHMGDGRLPPRARDRPPARAAHSCLVPRAAHPRRGEGAVLPAADAGVRRAAVGRPSGPLRHRHTRRGRCAVARQAPRRDPRAAGWRERTAFQTGLMNELASQGYAVVAIELPREGFIVEQPDRGSGLRR